MEISGSSAASEPHDGQTVRWCAVAPALLLGLVLVGPVLAVAALFSASRRFVRTGSATAAAATALSLMAGGYGIAVILSVVGGTGDAACLDAAPSGAAPVGAYRASWGLWPPARRCWFSHEDGRRTTATVGGLGPLIAGATGTAAGAIVVVTSRRQRIGRDGAGSRS
jgi:hypothetical protein